MGFFSFIESFFFLSLGITFVLIFLMVFHFKQRVEQLEKKSENMLEVCNGLVQQIHSLKTFCISNRMDNLDSGYNTASKISENITFSTSSPIPIPDLDPSSFQKIVVEDFEEEEEDEEEEEEEDEEEEEVMDVSDELDTIPNPHELLFLSREPTSTIIEEVEVELNAPIMTIGIEEVEVDLDLSMEEIYQEEVQKEEQKEEVQKEEEQKEEEQKEDQEVQKGEEDIDIKNLSLPQLRQLVSNKGLSTNPNKMKKQELVQLLQKPSNEKSLQDLALLL